MRSVVEVHIVIIHSHIVHSDARSRSACGAIWLGKVAYRQSTPLCASSAMTSSWRSVSGRSRSGLLAVPPVRTAAPCMPWPMISETTSFLALALQRAVSSQIARNPRRVPPEWIFSVIWPRRPVTRAATTSRPVVSGSGVTVPSVDINVNMPKIYLRTRCMSGLLNSATRLTVNTPRQCLRLSPCSPARGFSSR